MASPTTVGLLGSWVSRGVFQTTWDSLMINTTGDVGSPQTLYGGLGVISVMFTASGTLASDGVVVLEESIDGVTYSTCNTICGTPISVDSATGTGLSTGVVYLVRPGARFYRPHFTAGASGAGNVVDVIMVQSAPAL